MQKKPILVTADLEGVIIPEVWITVAEKTKIEKLRLTTRDISDYDKLMKTRLKLLMENNISLHDIQTVIDTMDPLPGAKDFLQQLRKEFQLIILSDTYYEFASPLMKKLGYPTLFCHTLTTNSQGMISHYNLRIPDGKKKAVLSFKSLGYYVISIGDSYNDITMLKEADQGILFNSPDNVIRDFPQFPLAGTYGEIKDIINKISSKM